MCTKDTYTKYEPWINPEVYRGMMRAQSEDTEVTSLLEEILTAIKDGKKIVVDGRELVSIYDNRKSRNGFSFT